MRMAGRNKKVWNWAVDYKANNSIEHGFRVIASSLNYQILIQIKLKTHKKGKSFLSLARI